MLKCFLSRVFLCRLASDDCQVGEYSAWGECTGAVCGGTGKQYRQRYYKNPDKATKCHRKLFETKTCIMPRCTHGINTIVFYFTATTRETPSCISLECSAPHFSVSFFKLLNFFSVSFFSISSCDLWTSVFINSLSSLALFVFFFCCFCFACNLFPLQKKTFPID